jgi:transcription initiation factor TFIID TATA-box-binding protein
VSLRALREFALRMRKRKYTPLSRSTVDSVSLHESTYVDSSNLETAFPSPTIHNIVSTSQIKSGAVIDLPALSMLLPFSFYDKQRFAAITIRLKSPDCTTLLFSSGKLVVTGGRNWYECVLASLCVCNILRQSFPSREFNLINCEIQNIVAHVELPVASDEMLDIHSMYSKLELHCMYQKTMFPGLIYRPESSPVVLLCFYSGKIVITGGKTTQDVFEGWKKLWPTVKVFMRKKK